MRYNTRFGRVIEISLEEYLSMSDDELSKKEEEAGTPLQAYDPLYLPLLNTPDIDLDTTSFIEIDE